MDTMIEALREKAKAATPGPWKDVSTPNFDSGLVYTSVQPVTVDEDAMKPMAMMNGEYHVCRMSHTAAEWRFRYHRANAAYIAAANPDTILGLLDRLERAEKALEWQPIDTCPIRTPVDLWCVYGGEQFAQFEGGASIGQLVSNQHKTEEYGFFGNQSNDGVPRKDGPDLKPVAWRPAVRMCPPEIIAAALGVPVTYAEAAALSGDHP